jgi:amino acid transporter
MNTPPSAPHKQQADARVPMDPVEELLAFFGVRPFTRRREHNARAANARLVAMTGLALLVLLPLPYVTALSLELLWRVHYFSALLLIPLLMVKLAGTSWRALRYYMGDKGFREDGPPHPMPRLTAPILVVATAVLFLSGVVMMLGAARFGTWSTIHNGAAIIFTGALGLHLLAHLWDTPKEVAADLVPSRVESPVRVAGSRRRVVVTTLAFVIGITVATAAMPVSHWQSRPAGVHGRDG